MMHKSKRIHVEKEVKDKLNNICKLYKYKDINELLKDKADIIKWVLEHEVYNGS